MIESKESRQRNKGLRVRFSQAKDLQDEAKFATSVDAPLLAEAKTNQRRTILHLRSKDPLQDLSESTGSRYPTKEEFDEMPSAVQFYWQQEWRNEVGR